jgi:hypothetical protein
MIMKYTLLKIFSVFLISMFLLTSCYKKKTCKCSNVSGTSTSQNSITTNNAQTLKQFEADCNANSVYYQSSAGGGCSIQ